MCVSSVHAVTRYVFRLFHRFCFATTLSLQIVSFFNVKKIRVFSAKNDYLMKSNLGENDI